MLGKLRYNNVIKEITVPRLLSNLRDYIHAEFSIINPYHLYYKDIDKDLIYVSSQEDYDIALSELMDSIEFIIKDDESKAILYKENINGTNSINNEEFKVQVKNSLFEKMAGFIKEEVKKQMKTCYSELDTNFSQIENSSQPVNCSICKKEIMRDKNTFCCILCTNLYICKSCKPTCNHCHCLLSCNIQYDYKMKVIKEANITQGNEENKLCKIWEVKNNGKMSWPADGQRCIH